jgi:ribosomal protein L37E
MNSANNCPRCGKQSDALLTGAMNMCGCCGLQWKPKPREIVRQPVGAATR